MTTASERLRELDAGSEGKITAIFRKTGSRVLGFDAFTRDLDSERVMNALPLIADVVEAAEPYAVPYDTTFEQYETLRVALTALREALGEKSLTDQVVDDLNEVFGGHPREALEEKTELPKADPRLRHYVTGEEK